MALPKFEKDVSNISKLPDMPNRKNGGTLDANEFKAEFDKAANDIKAFLNDTLLPYLESVQAAAAIGLEPISGLSGATDLQTALEELKRAIDNTSTGSIPDRSLSGIKLIEKSVGHTELGDAAVEDENIADNTITGEKLADNTITGEKLADKSVEARHLGTAAVGNENIKDGSIDAAGKLKDGSITAKKYSANSIPETALQENAVTTSKILDAAITLAKLAADAKAAFAPAYTYGTSDLTAGSSALTTGKVHFVYE